MPDHDDHLPDHAYDDREPLKLIVLAAIAFLLAAVVAQNAGLIFGR